MYNVEANPMNDTQERPLSDAEFLALDAERPRREVTAGDNSKVSIVQMLEPDYLRLLSIARNYIDLKSEICGMLDEAEAGACGDNIIERLGTVLCKGTWRKLKGEKA